MSIGPLAAAARRFGDRLAQDDGTGRADRNDRVARALEIAGHPVARPSGLGLSPTTAIRREVRRISAPRGSGASAAPAAGVAARSVRSLGRCRQERGDGDAAGATQRPPGSGESGAVAIERRVLQDAYALERDAGGQTGGHAGEDVRGDRLAGRQRAAVGELGRSRLRCRPSNGTTTSSWRTRSSSARSITIPACLDGAGDGHHAAIIVRVPRRLGQGPNASRFRASDQSGR